MFYKTITIWKCRSSCGEQNKRLSTQNLQYLFVYILLTNDRLTVGRIYILLSIKNAKVITGCLTTFEISDCSQHSNQRNFNATAEFLR